MGTKEQCIKNFLNSLNRHGYTIMNMLGQSDNEYLMKEIIWFFIGIEYNGNLLIFDEQKGDWKEPKPLAILEYREKYIQIEKFFSELITQEKRMMSRLRCIGGVKKEAGNKLYVYYYIAVDDSKIDLSFLNCVEKKYYEWISYELALAINATDNSLVESGERMEKEIKEMKRSISVEFQKYMLQIFGIDVDSIIALSSIFYEGIACSAMLVFLLTDQQPKQFPEGITLDYPIDVKTKNIRKIRKLLQMGKEGQCLLVCKDDGEWKVTGLYKASDLKGERIAFQIIGHMVWSMEVNGKFSVSYKCGELVIENETLELDKIERKYKEVFKIEKISTEMGIIFKEVLSQKHGTVLVIIKNDGAQEVDRLIKDSTGTKIRPQKLQDNFTNSITSIDGALIIDDAGLCYGFGMILDSNASIQGNPERGARYNSTRKYIKMCQDKNMTAIGVVVSEDKMVDIFTTEDMFDGGDKNAEK